MPVRGGGGDRGRRAGVGVRGSTTTRAPGAVVPVTCVVALGDGRAVGRGGDGQRGLRRAASVDVAVAHDRGLLERPARRRGDRVSRTSWACAQVSGAAEPAGCAVAKPIDAVAGSVPYGDAARSGFSQACSGTRPTPEAKPSHDAEQGRRAGAVAGRQQLLGALAGQHRPQVPGARVASVGQATACPRARSRSGPARSSRRSRPRCRPVSVP